MHEADRLAKKLSVATSRVAKIMSLGESEIVDGTNRMHIIPTAILESDHAKTYLRARTVMLRAVSYRKSKPDPGLDAQIASLWSAPTEVVLFEVWERSHLKGYADAQKTSYG